jgi:hypothetical protein
VYLKSKVDFTVDFVRDFAIFVTIKLVGESGGDLVKISTGWKAEGFVKEHVSWPPARWTSTAA